MRKFKKFAHTFVVHSLVFSLIQWSVPLAFAQQEQGDGSDWARTAVGITQQVGGQLQQVQMQNAAMAQQAAIMGQLQPKLTPARFFPQCQVPQASNTPPEGVCDQVQSPMQLGQMMGYQQLAHKYYDFYTAFSSPAQNTPFPQGLQCIEEAAKKTDAQMQDKLNTLTALSNNIKKQTQLFKEENARLLEEMQNINTELNGGTKGGNIDQKTKDYAAQFSQGCQNMLGGPSGINQMVGQSGGLLGLQNSMDKIRGTANDFTANQSIYKKDIDNLVNKMVNGMKNEGIESWSLSAKDAKGISKSMFNEIGQQMEVEKAELAKYKAEIQTEISKLGIDYSIPKFDRSFSVDFDEFKAGAKNFYQKQYVHECVTGEASTGLGMTSEQIMRGLQQRGTRGKGNAVDKYREALQNILNQDNYIEDKLAQIRALDAQFAGRGEITITYNNTEARQVTTSPYQLYMETVKSCQNQFNQDNTFSTSSRGISMKKKVNRLQGYLDQLKKKHDGFLSNAAASITDSLINCNGAEFKAGPGSCNEKTMSPGTGSFCMAHAQKCSATVNNCVGQVKQAVEKKKQALKGKANIYNDNMGTLIARQEAMLKQVQQSVVADSEFIKNFFPGANYTFPKDLFVAMPEMTENNPFGVALRGGGKLDSIEQLPEKIELLKRQLAEQKGKVQQAIGDYANKQKTAITVNKTKWKAFGDKCKGSEQQFRAEMARQQAEQQRQFAEKKQEVGDFCAKFKRLKNLNSAAGCGKVEDLYGDSNKIAAHLNGDVMGSLDAYTSMCERDNQSEDEDEDKTPKIARMCDRKSWDSIKKDVLTNVLRALPSEYQGSASAIEKYIKEGKPDNLEAIDKNLANSDIAGHIQDARDLHKLKGLSKDDYDQRMSEAKGEDSGSEGNDNNDESPTRKAIKDLAERIKNMVPSGTTDFDGMISNIDRARTVDQAKADLGRLKSAVESKMSRTERINSQNIDRITGALGTAGLASLNVGLLSEAPASLPEVARQYTTSRGNLQASKENLLDSYFTTGDNGSKTLRELGVVIKPDDGSLYPNIETIKARVIAQRVNPTSANEFISQIRPKIRKVEADQGELTGFEDKYRTALSSYKDHLEDQQSNSPMSRLMAEVSSSEAKLDSENFGDSFKSDDGRNVASTSDFKSGGEDDLCKNIENEINLISYEECVKDDNPTKCQRQTKEEHELNESNGVKSNLSKTKLAHGLLIDLDKGRGIASKQEWSAIGENSSDACEATAMNGRSVGGIDLGEFDFATGASPLGGMGAGR